MADENIKNIIQLHNAALRLVEQNKKNKIADSLTKLLRNCKDLGEYLDVEALLNNKPLMEQFVEYLYVYRGIEYLKSMNTLSVLYHISKLSKSTTLKLKDQAAISVASHYPPSWKVEDPAGAPLTDEYIFAIIKDMRERVMIPLCMEGEDAGKTFNNLIKAKSIEELFVNLNIAVKPQFYPENFVGSHGEDIFLGTNTITCPEITKDNELLKHVILMLQNYEPIGHFDRDRYEHWQEPTMTIDHRVELLTDINSILEGKSPKKAKAFSAMLKEARSLQDMQMHVTPDRVKRAEKRDGVKQKRGEKNPLTNMADMADMADMPDMDSLMSQALIKRTGEPENKDTDKNRPK